MSQNRRETIYLLRIWREPIELAAPGEWRGLLRSTDGRRQGFFRSAEELWALLLGGQPSPPASAAPAETSLNPHAQHHTLEQPPQPDA